MQKKLKAVKEKARKIGLVVITILIGCSNALSSITTVSAAEMRNARVTLINNKAHGYKVHGATGSNGNQTERYNLGGYELITMDGYGTVFCLEPWASVNNGDEYQKDDINNVINNQALNTRISLIGYYGYQQTDKLDQDYVTTQLMIWESRGWTVDKAPSYYSTMKEGIEGKISSHAKVLSFNQYDGTVNVGQTLTLTDTNGVLGKFMGGSGYPDQNTTYEKDGVQFSWSGDSLSITPTEDAVEDFRLPLQNIANDDVGTSVAFINYQALSPVDKVRDPSFATIKLDVLKYGKMGISKQDEDGTYIPNTSFSLSYNANMSEPLGTYTTGTNGKVLVEQLLAKKVYVQETSVPDDLILDSTIQSVTIPANDTATNTFKKGHLEISKQDEDGTKMVPIVGASTVSMLSSLWVPFYSNDLSFAEKARKTGLDILSLKD